MLMQFLIQVSTGTDGSTAATTDKHW